MSRGKRKKNRLEVIEKITITFICPNKEERVEAVLSIYDFSASDSECSTCGSHGWISVNFRCPLCGAFHDYDIQSW